MAHMHYTGTGKMHSFKGLLADGVQERIRIQGSVGAVAWRITKLQAITTSPGTTTAEAVIKIYREEQSTIDAVINFDDVELLGVVFWSGRTSAVPGDTIIFDNSLFTRNIYVTAKDVDSARDTNYYIELEEVKVSAAGMAQLAVAAARRTL